MVRFVFRSEVTYGRFNDYLASVDACNAICRERGWAEFTAMCPSSGKMNEVVLSADYPDLSTATAERDAALADPEFMNAWRPVGLNSVQGSAMFEFLEPAPRLA